MTIFARIINGEIPARKVLETEHVLAFHDVNPQAPVHVLVVPKRAMVSVADAGPNDAELLGLLMLAAAQVAVELGISDEGYRVVTNVGQHGGQSVPHLHLHVLGGRQLGWPPG
jgi:histidine triad (HIT) family protein